MSNMEVNTHDHKERAVPTHGRGRGVSKVGADSVSGKVLEQMYYTVHALLNC